MRPRGLMGSSARAADPVDMTMSYNTPLAPHEEQAFQEWVFRNNRARDLYDYDLRGFFRSGEAFAKNGHGSDRWKKPNHPTFSNESVYSGPDTQGGQWVQSPGGKWLFVATPQNLKFRNRKELGDYFRDAEPGNGLIPPADLSGLLPR